LRACRSPLHFNNTVVQHYKSFGAEIFNRHWDKLGFSACELLGGQPELLKELPQDIKSRIAQLARLGNQFARTCCASCGMPVPDGDHPQMSQRLQTLFDPEASPLFDD
jgi:hypothetical protein